MDYTTQLKRKSVMKSLVSVILLLALGVALLVFSNGILLLKKPANLYSVPEDELEGKYVTVDLGASTIIYDWYAQTEQSKEGSSLKTITSREYIIDANENSFCGLLLPQSMIEAGDALMEECADYLDYETDEITKGFTVTGIMRKMPADSLEFYHEYMDYDARSAEEQAMILPLYLEVRTGGSVGVTWVMVVLGLALIVLALVRLIRALSGKNQKQLTAKAEELAPGNAEYILNQVQELCQSTPAVGGVRMNSSLLYLENGAKQYLYGAKDVCWAYKNTVTHRTNGIPTGKSYNLMLKLADGSTQAMSMSEPQVDEMLQRIFVTFPGCVVGYSKEWETLFKKDRQEFARLAAAQRAQQPQQSAAPAEQAEPAEAEPQA